MSNVCIAEELEFITKKRIQGLWGINPTKEKVFTPEIIPGGKNQFIIWLNGLSLNEQIVKTGGPIRFPFEDQDRNFGIRRNRFWTNVDSEIVGKVANQKSLPGYYLVKILENFTDDVYGKNLFENWRGAQINEASEILQSILYVSGIRYLWNGMHIALKSDKIVIAVGDFKPGQGLEIWRSHEEIFRKYKERSIVLIHRAMP